MRPALRSRAISIHAPRVGSDAFPHPHFPRIYRFLSTLPAWGATFKTETSSSTLLCNFYPRSPRGERPIQLSFYRFQPSISIHAPRVGSDAEAVSRATQTLLFLSTLPAWGATASMLLTVSFSASFLSTLPAWGATSNEKVQSLRDEFLSTLPAWGATGHVCCDLCPLLDFYPRSPRGERLTRPKLLVLSI